ncbi:MAG: hypothetical protein DRP84_10125 [Spirochaetes bacterium]|nr:MAG: hypothetical protein DRP84_10125 [Spirochaetota bacterium]
MAYYKFRNWKIPERMRVPIENYLKKKIKPGDFLIAIFENNFVGAFAYADEENLNNLPAYGYWLWNKLLFEVWKSKEKVRNWLRKDN